jgi:tetratricopeptide (TPR) repeat protein
VALPFFDAPASRGGRSLSSASSASLRELDELATTPDARGFIIVHAEQGVRDAIARHVERRARTLGRPVVHVGALPTDDPWRELSARFVAEALACDPPAAARALLDRAGAAILVIEEGEGTHYGRALASELARAMDEGSGRALVMLLAHARCFANDARVLEIDGDLDADDRRVWWEAVARDGGHDAGRLDALESWWARARTVPPSETPSAPALGAEARSLFARIALARRSWPVALVGRLGTSAAAQELVAAGVLALDDRACLVAGPIRAPVPDADEDDVRAAAAALDAIADPWASARASELHALSGAQQAAEASALRAIGAVPDASARADLWQRWERTLARFGDADALPPLLRAVDVALHVGDVERAVALGTQALARRPDAFGTLLALGRTNLARGDLPTASHWLGKALAVAGNSRALVEVELAELCHMEGDMEGARQHARAVVFADAATRLHARNVLGKVLLAQKAWSDAETHFAADACEAVVAGDLMGELRARGNRAIAVLSSGRLEDARAMLGEVLAESEAGGEVRISANALTNLAAIATLRREYVDALRLSERAFEARRRLGDKVTLALLITNMAELKLQLGMVAEAEQALTFGRHACGPAMPGSRASHFALTAALVHLARGRTVEARAEL